MSGRLAQARLRSDDNAPGRETCVWREGRHLLAYDRQLVGTNPKLAYPRGVLRYELKVLEGATFLEVAFILC